MAKGLYSQVGALDVDFGAPGFGANDRFAIQVDAIAAAATVKGRLLGSGGAWYALKVTNMADRAAAALGTITVAGVYDVDSSGLEIRVTFGAGTTTYATFMTIAA